MSETKVITGKVRFSYANVFEPKAIAEGWVSPPEMYAKIRHLMKVLEIAESSIKDTVADHTATNYSKQSLTIHGLVIKNKTGASRATYPNNPLIEDAAKRLSALQDIAKTLQKSGDTITINKIKIN